MSEVRTESKNPALSTGSQPSDFRSFVQRRPFDL